MAKAINWILPGAMDKAYDVRKLSTIKGSANKIIAVSWRNLGTFAKKYLMPHKLVGSAVVARRVVLRNTFYKIWSIFFFIPISILISFITDRVVLGKRA